MAAGTGEQYRADRPRHRRSSDHGRSGTTLPRSWRSDGGHLTMHFATLGSTGIQVSRLALGAGPVPELMTVEGADRQLAVVGRAIELGINWFDTAATYGEGRSEQS